MSISDLRDAVMYQEALDQAEAEGLCLKRFGSTRYDSVTILGDASKAPSPEHWFPDVDGEYFHLPQLWWEGNYWGLRRHAPGYGGER